jgi:hypothetical protein
METEIERDVPSSSSWPSSARQDDDEEAPGPEIVLCDPLLEERTLPIRTGSAEAVGLSENCLCRADIDREEEEETALSMRREKKKAGADDCCFRTTKRAADAKHRDMSILCCQSRLSVLPGTLKRCQLLISTRLFVKSSERKVHPTFYGGN